MRKTDFLGRVIRFFKYNPWWLRLVDWSKTHSLPGLKRIPLYNLISFIDRELKEDALITRANSMSFSFFLALFPATIVMFTLLAYTPTESGELPILALHSVGRGRSAVFTGGLRVVLNPFSSGHRHRAKP